MNKTRAGNFVTRCMAVLGATWLGAITVITARQHQILFDPAPLDAPLHPRSDRHVIEPVMLHAADSTPLHGWLALPTTPGPHPAVVYFGGRSEEVVWTAQESDRLFPGIAGLAFNYRGSGRSHGRPSERRLVDDGGLLLDWLSRHPQIDRKRIAIVGRSLGSGVAMQVAARRRIDALVLISPFDSVLAMVRKKLPSMPVGWMLRHPFESINHAASIDVPVLVLRAQHDDIVPAVHTDNLVRRLANVVADVTIPGSDHGNVPFLAATHRMIAQFLTAQFFPSATMHAGTPEVYCAEAGPAHAADMPVSEPERQRV